MTGTSRGIANGIDRAVIDQVIDMKVADRDAMAQVWACVT